MALGDQRERPLQDLVPALPDARERGLDDEGRLNALQVERCAVVPRDPHSGEREDETGGNGERIRVAIGAGSGGPDDRQMKRFDITHQRLGGADRPRIREEDDMADQVWWLREQAPTDGSPPADLPEGLHDLRDVHP